MSNLTNQNNNESKEYLKIIYKQISIVFITNIISIILLELVVVILIQKVFSNWILTFFLALLFVIILGKGFKKEQKVLDEINEKYSDFK